MITSAPRLRDDLAVTHQQTAKGSFYVVKDPLSGDFYRLRDAERFVAQQLDGETSLEAVREKTEERFGATLQAGTLKAFIDRLERAGLLEGTARKKNSRGRRIRGSVLYLRCALFDPDRLLDRLAPRTGWFFTPLFLALSAAVILLAAGVTIGNRGALALDLSGLYRLWAIPVLLVVSFVVGTLHELAHGVTCKRLGGEVHEMGFMAVYLQPALYCDVSDAWLFPERSKRLWVGFAGPYFELFLWGLATLAWRLTETATWVNSVALIVLAVSGVKTLLNLSPFLKLDGYYLLSDWLEMPNLRARSFRYVGDLVAGLFTGRPRAAEEVTPAERRIYLSYGLSATLISFAFLAWVVVTTGGFLIERHQPAALFFLASVVGMKSRRKIRKLFRRPSDPSDDPEDAGNPDPPDDTAPSGAEDPEKTKARPSGSWTRRFLWAAAIVAGLAALFLGRLELRIMGPFNVLPQTNADVRPAVEGIVESILVDEGDAVEAGAIVARLSNETLVAEMDKADAEMRETRSELRKLEAGSGAEEIELARAGLSKAKDRLEFARGRLSMIAPLHQQGLLSGREFEDLREQAATAEHELEEARGRLNVVLRGSRPEEIDATRARLDRLLTQQRYLEEQVQRLVVRSPVAGIVATPSRELRDMIRRFVAKGELIARVHDLRTVTAQILVSEKEIADVSVGQEVVLRARAFPERTFHGTVTSIATAAWPGAGAAPGGGQTAAAAFSPSGGSGAPKSLVVTTQIANDSLLLKPEMTGQAKVMCHPRRIVDLITRRLARTFKVEVWSWW